VARRIIQSASHKPQHVILGADKVDSIIGRPSSDRSRLHFKIFYFISGSTKRFLFTTYNLLKRVRREKMNGRRWKYTIKFFGTFREYEITKRGVGGSKHYEQGTVGIDGWGSLSRGVG
jgi:hypothetical protein